MRVGRRADPLLVEVAFQGEGRFDDPLRLVPVLYAAPTLRTCLYEFLLARSEHPDHRTRLRSIAVLPAASYDEEQDAERDRQIEKSRRYVPRKIFERDVVHIVCDLTLVDLKDVGLRHALELTEPMRRVMCCNDVDQLDLSAITGPVRKLTQEVTRWALWDYPDDETPIDGITSPSRHSGNIHAIFVRTPDLLSRFIITNRREINPDTDDLQSVALSLGLMIN